MHRALPKLRPFSRPRMSISYAIDLLMTPRGWRYSLLLSAVLVGISTLIRALADQFLIGDGTYITFYWAVTLSAFLGGPLAAAVSLVASGLIGWTFFAETDEALRPRDTSDPAQLLVFTVSSCVEAGFALMFRRALLQLRARDRELTLVAAELNHRVKNNLAIITSLARQTAKFTRDIPDFLCKFTARVQALSKCNEIITRKHWGDVPLSEIVTTALRPMPTFDRVAVHGTPDDLEIAPRAAVSLSLIVHELATNAAKYGALSTEGGRLEVGWRRLDSAHGLLDWSEITTSPTAPPTATGFGTLLIRRLASCDLGGDAEIDYQPNGVHAVIRFALRGATA